MVAGNGNTLGMSSKVNDCNHTLKIVSEPSHYAVQQNNEGDMTKDVGAKK